MTVRVHGDVEGVSLRLLDAVLAAAGDLGHDLGVNSGYRSEAEQARLRDLWERGLGAPANRPGSSRHEVRSAVDLHRVGGVHTRDLPRVRAALARHGVVFTVPSEPWHAEHVDDRRLSRAAAFAAPHWPRTSPYTGTRSWSDMATKEEFAAVLDARLKDLDTRIRNQVRAALDEPRDPASDGHRWSMWNRVFGADSKSGAALTLLERIARKVGA